MRKDIDLFSFLGENLESCKDKVFSIDGLTGHVTTHGQFRQNAASVGSSLVKRGLNVGDVICIFAQNCVEFLETMLGCIGVGGIASPENSAFTPGELRKQVWIYQAVMRHWFRILRFLL